MVGVTTLVAQHTLAQDMVFLMGFTTGMGFICQITIKTIMVSFPLLHAHLCCNVDISHSYIVL